MTRNLNKSINPLVHVAVLRQLVCSMDNMRELLARTKFTKGRLVSSWNNASLIKELICQREYSFELLGRDITAL